jgi:hypothetical protein
MVLPSSSSVPALMKATAPRPCACATYPRHNDSTLVNTDSRYACIAFVQYASQHASCNMPTMHHDGTCGMTTCGMTWKGYHALDGTGYKLTTKYMVRSKTHRAPIFVLLGFPERCMLSHNNYRDVMINAPSCKHTTYNIQRGVPTRSKLNTARAMHWRATARTIQHTTYCTSETARVQRVSYTAWHAHDVARSIVRNIEAQSEHLQHATHDGPTRRGRTHRLAVRDRAAFERDGPIGHVYHAAVLRTADAATPAAIGPPSTDRAPPLPPLGASARLASAPLASHAPLLLRCRISPRHRTARCPWPCPARHRRRCPALNTNGAAAKPDPRPIEDRTCSTPYNALHDGALQGSLPRAPMQPCNMRRCNAHRCNAHRCNAHRCNAHRCNHATRTDATRTDATCQHTARSMKVC